MGTLTGKRSTSGDLGQICLFGSPHLKLPHELTVVLGISVAVAKFRITHGFKVHKHKKTVLVLAAAGGSEQIRLNS